MCADFEEGSLAFGRRLNSARYDQVPNVRLVIMLGNVFGNLRDEDAFDMLCPDGGAENPEYDGKYEVLKPGTRSYEIHKIRRNRGFINFIKLDFKVAYQGVLSR